MCPCMHTTALGIYCSVIFVSETNFNAVAVAYSNNYVCNTNLSAGILQTTVDHNSRRGNGSQNPQNNFVADNGSPEIIAAG